MLNEDDDENDNDGEEISCAIQEAEIMFRHSYKEIYCIMGYLMLSLTLYTLLIHELLYTHVKGVALF